jgi:hypothetical protein
MRIVWAVAVIVGLMLFRVDAQATSCFALYVGGSYILSFTGVVADGIPVTGLAGVDVMQFDYFPVSTGFLHGSSVINKRGLPINVSQEDVDGSLNVQDSCFLSLRLEIAPLGELNFIGFVHEEGRWFQFASLFDPAVQITGVAHRIE